MFLFKARILVCKVRRISEDRSVFVLKDIIRLPDVEVKDYPEDQRNFELHNPGGTGYPITLLAHKDLVKAYWLKEIRQYASDLVALAEHAADDLQLSEDKDNTQKAEGTKIEPSKSQQVLINQQSKEELTEKVEAPKQEPPKPIAKVEPPKEEPSKPVAKVEIPKEAVPKPIVKVEPPKLDKTENKKISETPKVEEVKTAEKRKESLTKLEELEVKKIKATEESQTMSGRYSSSSFSASSKVVEGKFVILFIFFHLKFHHENFIFYSFVICY